MTYADLLILAEHHEQEAKLGERRAWHADMAQKLRDFAAAIVVAFPDVKSLTEADSCNCHCHPCYCGFEDLLQAPTVFQPNT